VIASAAAFLLSEFADLRSIPRSPAAVGAGGGGVELAADRSSTRL
jgi:hypothetical protein